MNQREKTLSVAVAAAGLLYAGQGGWQKYQAALERNSNQQLAAVDRLTDAQTALARGQKARKLLNRARRQSLPTNRAVAESLYQDWLRKELTLAGLTVSQLSDRSLRARGGDFEDVSIEVNGEGTLAQIADFLYRFASTGHLHRISAATLVPATPGNGDKVTATFTIDALILKDCERTDALATDEKIDLAVPAEKLRARIVDRNLFAVYKPTPKADPNAVAAGSIVSGMWYGERGWSFSVKTKDSPKLSSFHAGDDLEFGSFKGRVVDVDGRRVVVETAEGRREVRLGQNLGEAQPAAPAG